MVLRFLCLLRTTCFSVMHCALSFVVVLLPWSASLSITAYKLYPLRVRVVNIIGQVEWVTAAYIPVIEKQKEPASAERARERRAKILQRVLYLVFRTTFGASYTGANMHVEGRALRAFPRVLLYLADLPEEKAILGLKSGNCAHPCSSCNVHVEQAGRPEALASQDRDVLHTVRGQLEGAYLQHRHLNAQRRAHLEAATSAHSTVPAFAAMAGLSSAPFFLYSMVGFDVLHVRCCSCMRSAMECAPCLRSQSFEDRQTRSAASLGFCCDWGARIHSLSQLTAEHCDFFASHCAAVLHGIGSGSGSHAYACTQTAPRIPPHVQRLSSSLRKHRGDLSPRQPPNGLLGAGQQSS